MIRFLHISDIHFEDGYEHQRTYDAFIKDIKEQSKNRAIDIVVCTGDIALKGRTKNEDKERIITSLKVLKETVGIDVPFLLVPGNHDVDIQARKSIYQAVFDNIKNSKDANKFIKDIGNEKALKSHLEGFFDIAKELGLNCYGDDICGVQIIDVKGVKLGFALLNSAWRTLGGGINDYGNLFLGELQIDRCLEGIKDADIKIALMHHTLEWFNPLEKSLINNRVAQDFNALFCGHNHDNSAAVVVSNIGSCFVSNTGCIYQSRDYFNGYSIIDLDVVSKKWIVTAREYYYQRNVFDMAPRFSSSGSKEFFFDYTLVTVYLQSEVFQAARTNANSKLLSFASDCAPKEITQIFVEPSLSIVSEKSLYSIETQNALDGEDNTDLRISLKDIYGSSENVFFVGKKESGKTLLAHYLAVEKYMDINPSLRLGVVIDLSFAFDKYQSVNSNTIITLALSFINGELSNRDFKQLLEAGSVLVVFDNLRLNDKNYQKVVKQFMKDYGKNQYIATGYEDFIDETHISKSAKDIGFVQVIHINSFSSKQVNELVIKWMGNNEEGHELEKRQELLNKTLKKLNIPCTPFIISILMWVLEQKSNKVGIVNQASIIKVFIDGLLDTLHESKLRSEYDSEIQQHFLMQLAVHFDDLQKEQINDVAFERFVINYFDKRGLSSPRGFTDDLIKKGLLFQTDKMVGFKFDCFRAFFLAKKMATDSDVWKKIVNDGTVVLYRSEFDFLTGLSRDKNDVLRGIFDYVSKIGDNTSLVLVRELPNIGCHDHDSLITADMAGKLKSDIDSGDFDEDLSSEKDEVPEIPSTASLDHQHSRRRIRLKANNETEVFFGTLIVFSEVLRNSELVDDVELKQVALSRILESWARIIASMLEALEDNNLEQLMGNLDKISIPTDKIRPMMKLITMMSILSGVSNSLATPKLSVLFADDVSLKSNYIKLILLYVLLDSDLELGLSLIKKYKKQFRSDRFLLQPLLLKLFYLYCVKAKGKYEKEIKDVLVDVVMIFEGISQRSKSLIIERIEESRDNIIRNQEGLGKQE